MPGLFDTDVVQQQIAKLQQEVAQLQQQQAKTDSGIAELQKTVQQLVEDQKIVGIVVNPGVPFTFTQDGEFTMITVKLVKKTGKFATKAKPKASFTSFAFQDNQDSTCTVMGIDGAGVQTDISGIATLTPVPTSDTPTVATVGTPTGMTFLLQGVAPGTANITVTATWNDGSIGPFVFTLPVTVTTSPVSGITVTPGTPTVISGVTVAPSAPTTP
jgi:glycerophosphoryl diester phosphodiesterase